LCNDFRDDNYDHCYETRDMSHGTSHSPSVVGRRIKALREENRWSQERIGVEIGIDESSSRARISRYELGVHEPPLPTARLIAKALDVPLTYLYCEDDSIASLLLSLHRLKPTARKHKIEDFLGQLSAK
jgi:transcriptional regulator with XRE-family HTH domain